MGSQAERPLSPQIFLKVVEGRAVDADLEDAAAGPCPCLLTLVQSRT